MNCETRIEFPGIFLQRIQSSFIALRAFVSIFLFLLFASQTFSSFMMDGMYLLNKNYVAKTLCVNKANPQLHCDGKCYLSKQVQKETKDNTLPSASKKDKGDEVYFYKTDEPIMQAASASEAFVAVAFVNHLLPDYSSSLLKPPQPAFM